MTDANLDAMKRKILHFLAQHPHETFKPHSLARRLSLKGLNEFRALSRALSELHQAKSIGRGNRKRYGHAVPPPSQRMTGVLKIHSSASASVQLLPPSSGTMIISARFRGTALDGDLVSVAPLANDSDKAARPGEPLEGEVIEVVERSQKPIVGILEKGKNFFFVVPDDKRVGRDIYIPNGKTKGARPGQKVVTRIDTWESSNLNPEGQVIEVIGKPGDVHVEMTAVAREFQLPLSFPKPVLAEADLIRGDISGEEISRRTDLRKLTCFTIDPEDAKDFDDAVSLEPLPNGQFVLGVHIADVSHFIREGSALDAEAYKRGTSVYLADEVIPMLPEKLSNELCSLRPNEDRLTYSALMTVTEQGTVRDYRIVKSVIRSKHRFTYEEAQKIITTGKGKFASEIQAMHAMGTALLHKRLREGSVDFETLETKFRFNEKGEPSEIVKKERLAAHRLVEDFMLLANQTVAKHIGLVRSEQQANPFLYRIHDAPPKEKLRDLATFVEHLGYSLNVSGGVTSRSLQRLLNDVKGKEEENVVNEVAIRSMAKAVYSESNIGHFGLGFKYYTHFTSPIRRYPDLVVHRILDEYSRTLPRKRREHLARVLPDICKYSSERERVAMEAERASVKVMQIEYMKRHLGDEFDAIISGVTNFGFFVEITNLLVEGLVRVRDLEDDYYVYDQKKYALIGRRTKKRYRLGDSVRIKVVRVDPEERQMDFMLVP